MRLINTTSLELKNFIEEPTNTRFPRYAILSHTWGDDEVTFQDIQNFNVAKKKAGFDKIAKCCEVALEEGLGWAWVDTCCIDKTSSTELTEAINSMFKWYECSTICYAYLNDVRGSGFDSKPVTPKVVERSDWTESRWFTRGWTLQELVAPFEVIVYDCDWKQLGTKRRLSRKLEKRTRIPEQVLLDPVARRDHSVAARMSWAGGRQTTRVEDRAYSLLGLFDINNMPLVYGEGQKAMSRLHQHIMDTRQDDTIFLGGLTSLDQDLGALSVYEVESTIQGLGFLITPGNVPAQLPIAVYPLPDTSETSNNAIQLTNQPYTPRGAAETWERKDPRLRGDVLSMSMRIIQVAFFGDGATRIPITMKKQTQFEMDATAAKVLRDFDIYGVKAQGGSLCLGMLRCGTEDGRLLARYFLCFLANGEVWAYPTGIYHYTTPAEVHHWPTMPCHILLGGDAFKPYPVLDSLQDVAGWGKGSKMSGTFSNGWAWNETRREEDKNTAKYPRYGFIRSTTHHYQLSLKSTDQTYDLIISLALDRDDRGSRVVDIELQLRCPAAPEPDVQTVKRKHDGREGPVTELYHRLPVSGGSAELVVSVYFGVEGDTHHYSPMIRFRAFEASGSK